MVNTSADNILGMLGNFYPTPGEILKEARSWADSAGFAVVTRNSSRSTLYLTCACGGQPRRKKTTSQPGEEDSAGEDSAKKRSRKRTSIRCGCPFLIGANLRRNGLWEVSKIHAEHNHKLEAHPYVLQLHQKAQGGLPQDNNISKNSSIVSSEPHSNEASVPPPDMSSNVTAQDFGLTPAIISPPAICQPTNQVTSRPKTKPASRIPPPSVLDSQSNFTAQSQSLLNEIIGFLKTNSSEKSRQQILNKIQSTLNNHSQQTTVTNLLNLPQSLLNNSKLTKNTEPSNFPSQGQTSSLAISTSNLQDNLEHPTADSLFSYIQDKPITVSTPSFDQNNSDTPVLTIASLQQSSSDNVILKNLLQLPLDQGIVPYAPKNDGNDGFRALAQALLKDESFYQQVKAKMLAEANQQATIYQQLYWFNMPKLIETLQNEGNLFYTHDCPQLAANAFCRPVVVFSFTSPPALFLPLNPPTNPLADLFPLFLGQLPNNNWILLNIPRTTSFNWPPVCSLHQSVCSALGLDTQLTGVWRSFTTPRP